MFKVFYLILYNISTCVFVYIIFNNSFWLIDNGNSGFIGYVLYNWISNFLPNLNNEYIVFICIILSSVFFILSSNINVKYFLAIPKKIFTMLKRDKDSLSQLEIIEEKVEDLTQNNQQLSVPQQTFSFESSKEPLIKKINHLENSQLQQ